MQSMVKKIVVAALAGSIVLFIWGGFSHMVLFVGAGFKRLPNEDQLIQTLKTNTNKEGLFFFPSREFRHSTVGGDPFSASKLVIQFVSNFFTALIAAFIAASVSAGFWRRVGGSGDIQDSPEAFGMIY